QLLRQAAGGNARHGLITGDRGIGKSSLASQVQGIAKSDPEALGLLGLAPGPSTPEFVVAEHVAQINQGLPDLLNGILHDLKRSSRAPKFKVDLEFDLKFLKGKVIKEEGPSPDLTIGFVDEIERAWEELSTKVDGLL